MERSCWFWCVDIWSHVLVCMLCWNSSLFCEHRRSEYIPEYTYTHTFVGFMVHFTFSAAFLIYFYENILFTYWKLCFITITILNYHNQITHAYSQMLLLLILYNIFIVIFVQLYCYFLFSLQHPPPPRTPPSLPVSVFWFNKDFKYFIFLLCCK